MPVETTRVYMRRLSVKHRNMLARKNQGDLNLKKLPREPKPQVLTPEQRQELRKRFKDRKKYNDEKFAEAYNKIVVIATDLAKPVGKSPKACLRILMQLARIKRTGRETSLWNAFVSLCFDEEGEGELVNTSSNLRKPRPYCYDIEQVPIRRRPLADLRNDGMGCQWRKEKRLRGGELLKLKQIAKRSSPAPIHVLSRHSMTSALQ